MNKMFSGKCLSLAAATLSVLLMTSCGGSDKEYQPEYFPVILSGDKAWSIVDVNGKVVVEEEYGEDDEISTVYDGAYWVKSGKKFQLYSVKSPKKPLVADEFDAVTSFGAGCAVVFKTGENTSFINTKGKFLPRDSKEVIRNYKFDENGYAVCQYDDGYGIIDLDGKLIQSEYRYNIVLSEDRIVTPGGQGSSALVSLKGELLDELSQAETPVSGRFSEGLMACYDITSSKSRVFYLKRDGSFAFEVAKSAYISRATDEYDFKDGYATFSTEDDKWGVIDKEGEILIRPKYVRLRNLGGGLFEAQREIFGDMGLIDKDDNTVFDFKYSEIRRLRKNWLVCEGSTWQIVDNNGKRVGRETFSKVGGVTYPYVNFINPHSFNKIVSTALQAVLDDVLTPGKFGEKPTERQSYRRSIEINERVEEGITSKTIFNFSDYVCTARTHTERVGDGWFSYNKTVVDGFVWRNDVKLKTIGIWFNIPDSYGVDRDVVKKKISDKLKKMGFEEEYDTFTKTGTPNGDVIVTLVDESALNVQVKIK